MKWSTLERIKGHDARENAIEGAGQQMTSAGEFSADHSLGYHSGEITKAEALACKACGKKIQLHKTSVASACPKFQGTRFRKSH